MVRPFVLSLAVLIVGLGSVCVAQPAYDVSVWRWNVSVILDAQRAPAPLVGEVSAKSFGQRYERFSFSGLPEIPAGTGGR